MRALLMAVGLVATPGLAQSAHPPLAQAGALIGPALHVADLDRALRFYVDGLGMTNSLQMGSAEHRETILTFAGDPRSAGIILLSGKASDRVVKHGSGYDRTVIRMPDLDSARARLITAGFAAEPIRDVAKGYRMMMATDADGYRFELVQSGTVGGKAR